MLKTRYLIVQKLYLPRHIPPQAVKFPVGFLRGGIADKQGPAVAFGRFFQARSDPFADARCGHFNRTNRQQRCSAPFIKMFDRAGRSGAGGGPERSRRLRVAFAQCEEDIQQVAVD